LLRNDFRQLRRQHHFKSRIANLPPHEVREAGKTWEKVRTNSSLCWARRVQWKTTQPPQPSAKIMFAECWRVLARFGDWSEQSSTDTSSVVRGIPVPLRSESSTEVIQREMQRTP